MWWCGVSSRNDTLTIVAGAGGSTLVGINGERVHFDLSVYCRRVVEESLLGSLPPVTLQLMYVGTINSSAYSELSVKYRR